METSAKAKRKNPFGDLGRPTLRGVRKCHKCGTYNGTRGIICKNKLCDVVFKEQERKKGHSADAVKISTGSTSQLYSVRLRDRGPDYRAFVQLPYIQDVDGNPATVCDTSVLVQASLCFVDRCQHNGMPDANGVLKAAESNACLHIHAALNCTQQAEPLGLKTAVLDNLQVTDEMKHAIWLLATETSGPVVQRVTKSIMVVKCKVTAKQPLGFLHCAFYETSRKRQHPEFKFQCMCRAFKVRNSHVRDDVSRRCVHFYACICAFASDEKLSEEFAHYINTDPSLAASSLTLTVTTDPNDLSMYQEVEETLTHVQATDTDTMEVIISDDLLVTSAPGEDHRKHETLVQSTNPLLTLQDQQAGVGVNSPVSLFTTLHTTNSGQKEDTSPPQSAVSAGHLMQFQIQPQQMSVASVLPQKAQVQGGVQNIGKSAQGGRKTGGCSAVQEDVSISLTFQQWLASVTERINQTMHYGFSGSPDPLVFHAPQMFFECLQHRISAGSRKKRLPNYTTGFVRKEALPLGAFTKYTWHITNMAHVKNIFDANTISLELQRSFVDRGGTYEPCDPPQPDTFSETKLQKHTPIRPFELKTYLKVGPTSESKEPIPFIIEWIPDILPHSHIGELRIKFEYGHMRNGQIEKMNVVKGVTSLSAADVHLQPQTVQLRKILPG